MIEKAELLSGGKSWMGYLSTSPIVQQQALQPPLRRR